MVVRDVIAHFAVSVDDSKLTKMDKSLDRLKAKVKAFAVATAAAFTAAGYAGYQLVTAASDADEALNVLTKTFESNSEQVLKWSKTVADAMGRSEYEFQDAVGKFGAFLTPIFKGGQEDVAGMSKKLSELAVDLASFYNTTDQEATMRLFSGMSGETEAVRRYGIDISDAALDAFNKASGDDRTMRALSMREKSMLRYRKILEDTALAQGDAEDTADSWANQVRRLKSDMKTIAVDMGRALMPLARKVLGIFHKLAKIASNWRNIFLKITSIFNTFLTMTLAYSAAWVIINRQLLMGLFYITQAAYQQGNWNKKLLVAVGHAAVIAAAFLAIEDVYSFLSGQESILGDVIKELTGTEEPLDRMKEAAVSIMTAFMNGFHYVKNAVYLLTQVPALLRLAAQGRYEELETATRNIMKSGVVDFSARDKMLEQSRADNWKEAVRAGGQEGLDKAYANKMHTEKLSDVTRRYLAERHDLIRTALEARPELQGKVGAGTNLGGGLVVTSHDVLAGGVPQEFLRGFNEQVGSGKNKRYHTPGELLQSGRTIKYGSMHIGKIDIIVKGEDAKDPKKVGETFQQGIEGAMTAKPR